MASKGRTARKQANDERILQSEVVARLMKEFGVAHPTAMRYLRNSGIKPIAKMSSHKVWYLKSEIDAWLSEKG